MKDKKKIPTIGVLAGQQAYYGTILGKFIGPWLYGIKAAAKTRGCNLLFACGMEMNSYASATPAWPTLTAQSDFVPVGPWNTDGLIVLNPIYSQSNSEYIQKLNADGFPIIFAAKGVNGPNVAFDSQDTIRQALVHLISHGHKQIAFIAGYQDDVNGDSGIRLRAFQHHAKELGIETDPSLIAYGNHGIRHGRQAIKQILQSKVPFTAVIASNDESALGAMDILKAENYRIPEDIAVIGIDNIYEAISHEPPLTTFHGSPFQMGFQALDTLLDYVEGKTEKLEDVDLPMQFVIRETCGCKPGLMSHVVTDATPDVIVVNAPLESLKKIVEKIKKTALIGVPQFRPEELDDQCERLVRQFIQSISNQEQNRASFLHSFDETIKIVASCGGDVYILNDALQILKSGVDTIQKDLDMPIDSLQVDRLLSEAGQALLQHMERRHRDSNVMQAWTSDHLGRLNAQLLNILNETEVYEVLAEFLPEFQLKQISVAFFEGLNADPVSNARLWKVTDQPAEYYFKTREFPPKELYTEPFHLALLPLALSGENKTGFVAFDVDRLEICAQVVLQLMTFFKTARLYKAATEARQLAEGANRAKSKFLSNMSHELRTPLNAIIGYSELIKDTIIDSDLQLDKDETIMADISKIESSGRHLLELINNILDLSKIDEGKAKLNVGFYSLPDIIDEVSLSLEPQILAKGLTFKINFLDEVFCDSLVQIDKLKVQQILINLLANAAKFTEQGGISLTIQKQDTGDGSEINFIVADTGIGIDPEFVPHLFERFDQEDNSLTRKHDGTGLGLAICNQLIRIMNGKISMQSKKGDGSVFFITVPTSFVSIKKIDLR